MTRDPMSLNDALARVSRDLGFDASTEVTLQRVWVDVVGAAAAEHAEPGAIRGGVLKVVVDSGAWATELRYLADEIVRRLVERGVEGIERVQITVRARPS